MKYAHQTSSPVRNLPPGYARGVVLKKVCLMALLAGAGFILIGHWAWRAVSAADPILNISTVAGSSAVSGLVADLQSARGIVSTADGLIIYVADTANHVVRKVDINAATVTVFAGSAGSAGFSGDNGAATAAKLSSPSDVALDSLGNLYIADTGNNRIRRVATNGQISTLAGTGDAGAADGAIAIATFSQPRGLGIDSANNIYVADTGNNRVRKITGSTVQTIVNTDSSPGNEGDGQVATSAQLNAPADVAVDSVNNKIYVADSGNNRVRVVSGGNINAFAGGTIDGVSGAPTDIRLVNPTGIAVEGSFVYIADTGNNRVRVVNTTTNTLDTLAGSGMQGYDGDGSAAGPTARSLNLPYGVAVASGGATIYLMDSGNRRLRKVMAGNLTTLVSDGSSGFDGDAGPATSARLSAPRGVAVDGQGNFYIADTANHVIRKVNKSDGKINTIAGTPGNPSASATDLNGDGAAATSATLNSPTAVVVDSGGNIYISDTGNNRIRRIDLNNNIDTVVGLRDGNAIGGVTLNNPHELSVDGSGNIYIADTDNNRIRRLLTNGTVSNIAGTGAAGKTGDGGLATLAALNHPQGVAASADGETVYIADTGNNRIRKLTFSSPNYIISSVAPTGINTNPGFQGDGFSPISARLNSPTSVALDASGNYYVMDRGNNRVRKVSINGTPGNTGDDIINTIIGSGVVGFSGDGGPAPSAAINFPYQIAVNADGVYVADTGNNRIRRATAPPNSGPTLALNCGGNACAGTLAVAEGQNLSLTLQGTDPDAGQTLTYSMLDTNTNQPLAGATLNASTGAFSYTPAFNVAPNVVNGQKTFIVEFKVTDNGGSPLSDSKTVTINVTNVNQSPTADSGVIPATVEATSAAGASLPLNGTASDPDGDTLTFQWSDGVNLINGATTLNPTVNLGLGAHSLILTVNDGKGGVVSTAAKPVTVQDTTPPVFTSVPSDINQPVGQGAGGAVINYTLPTVSDTVSGSCTINGNPCALTVSPADKVPGAFFPVGTTTVTFKATDGSNNMATASFKVIVGDGGSGGGNPLVYKIAAYAGSGNFGTGGNGGPALTASFKQPHGVVMDSLGNVYIADTLARVVRKVATDGTISNYVGTGEKGSTGDGGPATQAKLNNPTGLAVDSANNLYIADTGNHVVRKVTAANGLISTIAGSFVAGFQGDNGPGVNARLNSPTAVAVDGASNVYIADTSNHRVRKVTAANGLISTFAGSFIAGFSGDNGPATNATLDTPTGVAVTSDGSTVYIADQHNHRIRRVFSGQISTYAGNGSAGYGGDGALAAAATLNSPTGVAIDPDSNVVVTDTGNDRIRRINFSDNLINTMAGTGAAGNTGDGGLAKDALLDTPTALAIDKRNGVTRGEVYFSDSANLRVRRLTVNNAPPVPTTVASQTVRKDRTLDVPLSAADADGDAVTFSIVSNGPLPFLSIINANPSGRTATLHIAPNNGNVGVYNLQIKATDSKQSETLTPQFTVSITENRPPVASIAGGSQLTLTTGGNSVTLVLDGTPSSDPDGDPLTYDWKEGAAGLGTSSTITPTLGIGQHAITLTVSDGLLTNSFTQNITVNSTGGGPIAIINGPSSVNSASGQPVSVAFDGSSSTGNPTTYQWMVDGSPQGGNTPSLTPSLAVGNHEIKLTVTNASGSNTATKSVTVTVGGPTACIVGGATATVTASNGTSAAVTLDGSCTTGSGQLAYQWTVDGTVQNGTGVTLQVTLNVGTHAIKLKATDSQNRSSEATQTLTVQAASSDPLPCGDGVGLYICSTGSTPPGIEPSAGRQGSSVDVTINGFGFLQGATVIVGGTGITTQVLSVTQTKVVVRFVIASNAPTGTSNSTKRTITVVNPDGSTVSTGRVFGVLPK